TGASGTTSRTWIGAWTATSTISWKRSRSRMRPIASPASRRMATDAMSGTLRLVTIVNALIYFGAAPDHSGVLVTAGALAPAAIAEALLGLVLVAGLLGWLSPRVAYGIALAGTLFGLSIVVARGLLGVDLWIHVLMLVGLAVAFALIFVRRAARPETSPRSAGFEVVEEVCGTAQVRRGQGVPSRRRCVNDRADRPHRPRGSAPRNEVRPVDRRRDHRACGRRGRDLRGPGAALRRRLA